MPRARAVTSYQVAAEAGVSQAVVSSVLSGARGTIRVSEATRQRVLQVAADLGYTANHAARSLSRRRTNLITVVTYGLENPYYADIVHAAREVARAKGYAVTVSSVELGNKADERQLLDQLRSGAYDGVIDARTAEVGALTMLADLTARGVPAVTTWYWGTETTVPFVHVDLEAGGHRATRHLLELGHRRVAHVSEDGTAVHDPAHPVGARFAGYRRALDEAGVSFDPAWLLQAPSSLTGGVAAVERLAEFEPSRRPTALFVFNDVMALGALHGLRRAGLAVPGDVAVVGFDGLSWGTVSHPTLSTMDYPRAELGRRATELLFGLLGGETPAGPELLQTRLIVRDSCGAPQQAPLPD